MNATKNYVKKILRVKNERKADDQEEEKEEQLKKIKRNRRTIIRTRT